MKTRDEQIRDRVVEALANHRHRRLWYVTELARHVRCSSGQCYVALAELEAKNAVVRAEEMSTGRVVYSWRYRRMELADYRELSREVG